MMDELQAQFPVAAVRKVDGLHTERRGELNREFAGC